MRMRIPHRLALPVLVLLFAVGTGYSTHITQEKVSVIRALAGHVLVLGTDEPAGGVTVELSSSDWKNVLASTKTDEKGHFSFEQPATGKLFYMRVPAPGMDIHYLRVRINKNAKQELMIRLSNAT